MPTHDFPAFHGPSHRSGANPLRLIELIEEKLTLLAGKLGSVRGQRERHLLEPEVARLTALKAHLYRSTRRRKPPEAGIAIPAIPPRGPLPLQGGAEAPLEFDD